MNDNLRKWLPIAISFVGMAASLAIDLYFRKKQEKNGIKLDESTVDALKKANAEVLG